jgi:hypothetical protein
MSVIRRNVLQAKESLRQASSITDNLEKESPDLQELKSAAKFASQAAETLNRLVGMKMAESKSSK